MFVRCGCNPFIPVSATFLFGTAMAYANYLSSDVLFLRTFNKLFFSYFVFLYKYINYVRICPWKSFIEIDSQRKICTLQEDVIKYQEIGFVTMLILHSKACIISQVNVSVKKHSPSQYLTFLESYVWITSKPPWNI